MTIHPYREDILQAALSDSNFDLVNAVMIGDLHGRAPGRILWEIKQARHYQLRGHTFALRRYLDMIEKLITLAKGATK